MKYYPILFFYFGLLLQSFAPVASAQELTQQQVAELCVKSAAAVETHYVLAEKKKPIAAFLADRCRSAEYAKIKTPVELVEILTADLQKASGGDKHLYVQFIGGKGETKQNFDPVAWERQEREREKKKNFGLTEIQILERGVGYLKIEEFMNPDRGIHAAAAAMKFLEATDAMIIDVRGNKGGYAGLTEYFVSHYFPETPTLVSTTLFADKNIIPREVHTSPFVFGRRRVGEPLYILIDRRTASAAEFFAYTLQAFKKAVVVGEPSGGGAHMNSFYDLNYGFRISISTGAPINAVTKTNWEGKGVQPDIACNPQQAKETALQDYQKKLSSQNKN